MCYYYSVGSLYKNLGFGVIMIMELIYYIVHLKAKPEVRET